MYGGQNCHYQKAVLEGLFKRIFNKRNAFPNPPWAHAFVGGLSFCRTFESYKNQEGFCREHVFLSCKTVTSRAPHLVGNMLFNLKLRAIPRAPGADRGFTTFCFCFKFRLNINEKWAPYKKASRSKKHQQNEQFRDLYRHLKSHRLLVAALEGLGASFWSFFFCCF